MELKIKVTKEILERSKMCGIKTYASANASYKQNCAIALAVRDIFPIASVYPYWIETDLVGVEGYDLIGLPREAIDFIREFDKLQDTPEKRLLLPELEFTINIPENIIAAINIDEIKPLLVNHPTLSLA